MIAQSEATKIYELGRQSVLQAKGEPSSPYKEFNRKNNPSAYPKSGEGQQQQYEMEPGGQLKLPIKGVNRNLMINPEIAGAILPGERSGSSTGGLKGMKPSDVDRYLQENGITGPAADKIWKKYKGLQGGIDLPLAGVWDHETPSDTFNRQNYPGRDASDDLRIDHMRNYHNMKKKELA